MKEAYEQLIEELSQYDARLVAVSKMKPKEDILKLYELGHRVFGENRARQLADKAEQLPGEIEWHMIGHLQRNKVKYIIDFVSMIESVDSPRLMKEVEKRARKSGNPVDVLLQIKIAEEESKYGFDLNSLVEHFDKKPPSEYPHLQFRGVMGMATLTDDEAQIRREFSSLKRYFEQLKLRFFPDDARFREISMGMSADYKIALEEGATMVRIGSRIFGPRE